MAFSVLCLFSVIRAKVVGQEEVVTGNDTYGNPIKMIRYDVKQIKVNGEYYFCCYPSLSFYFPEAKHKTSAVLLWNYHDYDMYTVTAALEKHLSKTPKTYLYI